MNILNILYQSIFAPLGVVNRENVKGRLQVSVVIVLLTTLFGSIIAPVIYFYTIRNKYEINLDIGNMFLRLSLSIITWLAACTLLWLMAKIFSKGIEFGQIVSTWGLSYIPNFLCIVLYELLLIKPEIYSGNGFSAFILSSFFIMFLVWKAIYYFMIMKLVIHTTLGEFFVITAVLAIVFSVFMVIGFRVGIQVPML
jgi:hypothetical protein